MASTVRAGTRLTPAEEAALGKLLKLNLQCPAEMMNRLVARRWSEAGAVLPNQRASRYTSWKVKQWSKAGTDRPIHGLSDFLKRIADEPDRRISQQVYIADSGETLYIFRDERGEVFGCFVEP